jgi:gluconokinase
MNPLILALDVGTSSTRTALFKTSGRRLLQTTSHQAYSLRVGPDGSAELAVGDLEKAVLRAIRATLAARKKDRDLRDRPVVAVSASCFWHSLLGYDPERGPTPIYTWADARCHPDAALLVAAHDEKGYHAHTGCMLRTPYWPAKLRWLRRTRQTAGITRWMSPADWLYGRLAGDATTSVSMASGTGLMDGNRQDWDAALLRMAGIPRHSLTPISDAPRQAQKGADSSLPALHRFSELEDALWFPAIGDGAASNLGSDAVTPGLAALNVGTSAAARLVIEARPARLSTALFCYQVDDARSLIGGATSNAGNLRAWALRELRLPDDPGRIERALADRPWPRHGLTILPFWNGERAPSWPKERSGTIAGLTYATTALDLLQAVTESSYLRLAEIVDDLARHAPDGRLEIVVSGGVRRSPESLQRLAHVLGRPIRACTEPEASLRGAAVYVAERLGFTASPLRPGRLFHPKASITRAYDDARRAQVALEKRMERDAS